MPSVNRRGAYKKQVNDAVRSIEDCPHPIDFLQSAAREAETRTAGFAKWSSHQAKLRAGSLERLPTATRLAIEMATNEESERAALAGELSLLELAWEEAERIAAIADSLAIPADVDEKFEDLKNLGSRLKLPPGWKFRAPVLEKDLVYMTDNGKTMITQDELGNTYDRVGGPYSNYKP